MITHFMKFADENAAKAALPACWSENAEGWDWHREAVDAPIEVYARTGASTQGEFGNDAPVRELVEGYHLNIASAALDARLAASPGFVGALDDKGNVAAGNPPATPSRVFAT